MNVRGVKVKAETRQIIDNTVELVATAVTSTMGPNGKLVVIDETGNPKMTKDGVTVARSIRLDDRAMDIIAKMITEASIKTDAECGDGTTTTVFLTRAFYNAFKDKLDFMTKRRVEELTKETIEMLKGMTKVISLDSPVLHNLALTTSNNDLDIVDKLYDIFKTIPDPMIDYRRGVTGIDEIEYSKGKEFTGGYAHPTFTKDGSGSPITIESGYACIFEGKFSIPDDESEFLKLFDEITERGYRQTVVIAREFDEHTLMVMNKMNHVMLTQKLVEEPVFIPVRVQAIGTAGVGIIGDIATVLGLNQDVDYSGWKSRNYEVRPIENVVVKGALFFVGSVSDDVSERTVKRIAQIKDQIDNLPAAQKHTPLAKILRHRISTLMGNRVTVTVGGETASDIKERLDRFEDVGRAIASALTNGVLPGIGYSLAYVGSELVKKYPDDSIVKLYADVLGEQLHMLMGREFNDPELVYVNLATGETGKHPQDINVWDAQLATVTALRAGVSTAISLASTDTLIIGSRAGGADIP
ncbi:hypothetical protein [Stenotrophomonas phage BUCTxx100]|nr:hypothetical protein [Stenotrophomonas phage BUCTxx100]